MVSAPYERKNEEKKIAVHAVKAYISKSILQNASGSIPHDLLWHSMRRLGVPEEAVSILMDVYQGRLTCGRSHIVVVLKMNIVT